MGNRDAIRRAHCEGELVRQVEVVRALVEQTIGSSVLGIYLHGSVTDGGLKPASDLDLLSVTDRSLNAGERHALVTGLVPISGRRTDGWRSVELTIVVQSELRPWRYPPLADFLYGDWLRTEIAAKGPPQPGYMPNLAIEIPQLLSNGRTVIGPDPSALLDSVPVTDTIRGDLGAEAITSRTSTGFGTRPPPLPDLHLRGGGTLAGRPAGTSGASGPRGAHRDRPRCR